MTEREREIERLNWKLDNVLSMSQVPGTLRRVGDESFPLEKGQYTRPSQPYIAPSPGPAYSFRSGPGEGFRFRLAKAGSRLLRALRNIVPWREERG